MYKVVTRNRKTNDLKVVDLGTKLEEVDKIIAAYKSKENFLKQVNNINNVDDYDIFITYKTSAGYKVFDIHFPKGDIDKCNEELMNIIIDKLLLNRDFYKYICEKYPNIYHSFDVRNSKAEISINYLNKYFNNKSLEFKTFVASRLEDYKLYRKVFDAYFRFNDKKIEQIHEERTIDRVFSKIENIKENSMLGQIELNDFIKPVEPIGLDISNLQSKNKKTLESISKDEKEKVLNGIEGILNSQYRDEFNDEVYDSTLPKNVKSSINKLVTGDFFSNEDYYEQQRLLRCVRTGIKTDKNVRIVKEIIEKIHEKQR